MAPTEILAAQHSAKLAPLLLPFGITVDAVFGGMGARERRAAEQRIRSGEALVAVGTHALLTESTEFKRLALVVIDEQHRFGVAQRARLRAKGGAVAHALAMSATPIPRTLAQIKYADFDLSIIDELPPGRTPVDTRIVGEKRKHRAYEFIRKNIALGRQAYVVAPAIDGAEETGLTSAVAELEAVRRAAFADVRTALLHGRMTPREKEGVMALFVRGEIDVLLTTTVVEVGVDVPNANVMAILDAHRYGLAQLHQLRGRVGRGVERSYCLLIAPEDRAASDRLAILAATNDGFVVAEEDMRLRGAGELDGAAQSGDAPSLLGDAAEDFALYKQAKADVDCLVQNDPLLSSPEHRRLAALLDERAAARAALATS
jgi:ATP-dependent DNA helicase RecG